MQLISKELAMATLNITGREIDELAKEGKIVKIDDKFGLISVMSYKRSSKKKTERVSKRIIKKKKPKTIKTQAVIKSPVMTITKSSLARYRDYLFKEGAI
jgi:hypothetical protein